MTGCLSPPFLEPAGGAVESAIFVRSIGLPSYNGDDAHGNIDIDAGYWEAGDMLVAFFGGKDRYGTGTAGGYPDPGWEDLISDNSMRVFYRTAQGDYDDGLDRIVVPSNSGGAGACHYCQVIALAAIGGTVEFLHNVHTREQDYNSVSQIFSVPSLGIGPNANDTIVITYWHDGYFRTRPDLELWGSPKGFSQQGMDADGVDMSRPIGYSFGDPDNNYPPSQTLGYPWEEPPDNQGYYYWWWGWGYTRTAESRIMTGGDVITSPGQLGTPFWGLNEYSAGQMRFGLA